MRQLATLFALTLLCTLPLLADTDEERRNEERARLFTEEVYNQQKFDRIAAYVASDFVDYSPGAPPDAKGAEYVLKQAKGTYALFPDLKFSIQRILTDGDLVSMHWRSIGTSKDGVKATIEGISIFQMRDGMIVASWDIVDRLAMLKQLGFTITPPAKK